MRAAIAELHVLPEEEALDRLLSRAAPDDGLRARAVRKGADLVSAMRSEPHPGLMEVFLAEYGLSTREGIALMCLAEALLRVPDADTMDALIEDKIAPSEWGAHLGHSSSVLVNASTWALMLTGRVLQDGEGMASVLRGALRRVGEPVIRAAVARAMREMGSQFVLGETIAAATARAARMEAKGYTYSYDMLGEAALTQADADDFLDAYRGAIAALAPRATSTDIRANPGISIKLSALHSRYEELQRHRADELIARTRDLARAARAANMGLNIDAEEAERLDLSLDVIEAVLADPDLAGWDGFGVVVQAYSKRAPAVIDWLADLARRHDRKLMVRLVKGAYWDREIKRAQVEGLAGFPVYTRKAATDAAYLCCARLLFGHGDRLYPQFATHNAHTVAAIAEMAEGRPFEFQRLHGMGEQLYEILRRDTPHRVRIYAPVGAHRDLLAYLVRRLLENGANSSFVNQVLDTRKTPEEIAADPFAALDAAGPNRAVRAPADLFAPERRNSRGHDLWDRADLAAVETGRDRFADTRWTAGDGLGGARIDIHNPADPSDIVGQVIEAAPGDVAAALDRAAPWDADRATRADTLRRAADLYEAQESEIFALLAREAGKTLTDALAELREAVDFLRYYAARSEALTEPPLGVVTCISPWNFPLAIFTGQIAAALAAGNGVLAKPAEATPLVAARAVALLHEAGVPATALQLLPGKGSEVGAALTSDPRIGGVTFTGSTATAQAINRAMAANLAPSAPLIAETGGLNAMIVDSTALPEQAIRDIVTSAFRSAGQRCSALRMLYLQRDIAAPFLEMLRGAMDELVAGDPADRATDLGPVISAEAKAGILDHIATARAAGRVLHETDVPATGHFVPATLIDLPGGIAALDREVFGPVLHVATFEAQDLSRVVDAINARGYGLTFGMHSRIDDRVQTVAARIRCGNAYVNRNQIGAIVGSQPFGGEGLSGTGPKAGGPHYLPRFCRAAPGASGERAGPASTPDLSARLAALPAPSAAPLSETDLPGPTGEANRLTTHPRGRVLCLGPGTAAAEAQAEA
ncbi:bifunctional proline dehydrogenase/L-glutamate gamma-semialdehyde dehydrogenase PutA, partial [Rhodobacterales bacterium HKCCE2091]|nr:bifunctional proline dehydrogenase/L-glutamate gamma-semialdehyde dehydrogenase PutA [Rhodobacterales bacterium HKCCE2091]